MGAVPVQLGSKTQTGASTIFVTLTGAVTRGNFIVVGIASDNGSDTVTSLLNQSSVAYTRSPNSPGSGVAGQAWIFYLFNVEDSLANGTTLTATWGTNVGVQMMWVREFSGMGAGALNSDITGTGNGTVINTPSVTNSVGDLLYAVGQTTGTVTATDSPWAAADSNIINGEADEYLASSSGASTAVNWLQSSADWKAIAASFSPQAKASVTVPPVRMAMQQRMN